MKKLISLALILTLIFAVSACGNTAENTDASESPSSQSSGSDSPTTPTADALLSDGELNTGMKEKFDQMEYVAYTNIFYNGNAADYEGQTYRKDGTFAILHDAYSDIDRYYVWGYADNTKCCDYQWEFIFPEGTDIPEPGSYIEVEGTMTKDEKALDGYHLTDVKLTVKEEFKNAGFDMDLTTMSPTLVRVQIINMLQHSEKFENKTVRIFGRALNENTIQHPYYNESWTMHFTNSDTVPATGKYILLEGTFNADSTQTVTTSKLTEIG